MTAIGAITNLEVLSDLTNETLEGQLANEELRGLLVATNFTKGDGTRPEAMRLLDTTGCGLCEGRDVNNVRMSQTRDARDDHVANKGLLSFVLQKRHSQRRSYGQPWSQAACAGPFL